MGWGFYQNVVRDALGKDMIGASGMELAGVDSWPN